MLFRSYNASHLQVQSSALGGAKTQQAISGRGFSQLPQGGIVTTAVAQQGDNQCVSTYKTDTPTAQCQSFLPRRPSAWRASMRCALPAQQPPYAASAAPALALGARRHDGKALAGDLPHLARPVLATYAPGSPCEKEGQPSPACGRPGHRRARIGAGPGPGDPRGQQVPGASATCAMLRARAGRVHMPRPACAKAGGCRGPLGAL